MGFPCMPIHHPKHDTPKDHLAADFSVLKKFVLTTKFKVVTHSSSTALFSMSFLASSAGLGKCVLVCANPPLAFQTAFRTLQFKVLPFSFSFV